MVKTHIVICNTQLHRRFQEGAVHYAPLSKMGGGYTPLDFYNVITLMAFDLEQVIYDHRQVGQAGKNG